MRRMNERMIAQLEARLERIVEGTFTSLFRRRTSTHDIAIQIARAMEDHLRPALRDDPRPLAPDIYTIRLHPLVLEQIEHNRPEFQQTLSRHLIDLAAQSGYRVVRPPQIRFESEAKLSTMALQVDAAHSNPEAFSTEAMKPVSIPQAIPAPANAQFIINGERIFDLTQQILNIGRSDDNHIVLDDPFVSRHHLQVRLRQGMYYLFDVQSRSGTLVNDVVVREHRLRPGDVIQVGRTRMVYMSSEDTLDAPSTTAAFDPVQP